MPDCDSMRENMPLLLTESLDPARRELTHQHIETCPICVAEWSAYKETWSILDTLPEVDVPGAREAALPRGSVAGGGDSERRPLPPPRRGCAGWRRQRPWSIIAGGAFYGGHRMTPRVAVDADAGAGHRHPAGDAGCRDLLDRRVARPSGRVDQPADRRAARHPERAVHRRLAVERPDRRLVRHHLARHGHRHGRRTRAWSACCATCSRTKTSSRRRARAPSTGCARRTRMPAIPIPRSPRRWPTCCATMTTRACASRPRTRCKSLQSTMTDGTRDALVEALKNDPNPAVRIKAVEALAKLARSGGSLDPRHGRHASQEGVAG